MIRYIIAYDLGDYMPKHTTKAKIKKIVSKPRPKPKNPKRGIRTSTNKKKK